MYNVDDNTRRKVCELFGKTEQSAKEDVITIRKWIETQPHLPEIMDEAKIRNLLNLCKFDVEKTKEKVDMYYTMRSRYSDLYRDCNPKLPQMRQFMENIHFCTHPELLDGIHRVTFIRAKKPNCYKAREAIMLFFCIYEIRLQEDCVGDDVFIFDMANITFKDLTTYTPMLLYKAFSIYKNIFSLRVKAVHMVNSPTYVTYLLKLLKLFMKQKLYDRMYQVSEDTKKEVYQMFGRTFEMVDDDVETIKTWMKTQNHLPEIMEDAKIRNFLNLNKFSIENTKEKIDMYYTIRSLIPDFFENSNPKLPKFKRIFETTYISTHPTLLDGIHRIHFSKLKEPNTLSPVEVSNLFVAIFETRLSEDFMVDDVFVVDLANYTISDMRKATPTLVSKVLAIYKKVFSLRLKSLILINCPSYVSYVVTILKSVMKPKIFDRIQVHQDDAVLKELFSKDQLPKDYGGEGPSLQELNEMTQKKLSEYQNRFDQLDKLRTNENLRPEKLDNDEVLGFYGNFKKLNVD